MCLKTFYKSVQSGCLKCQEGGAPQAIAIMVGGTASVGLTYKLFKRYFGEKEQTHVKTVLKILFVGIQNMVKLPATFGIMFPAAVSLKRYPKSVSGFIPPPPSIGPNSLLYW